jgi:hypothetical protein
MADDKQFTDVFAFEDIEYRVGPTNKKARERDSSLPHKGQALPYITAAAARDRLDEVHGPLWSCSYREVIAGDPKVSHVECTITLHYAGTESVISRADVGEGREGTGSTGDPVKTAYTDAFKRAAQSFGIGRFLNNMPKVWVELNEYDQFTEGAYDVLRKEFDFFMERGGRPKKRGARASAPAKPPPSRPATREELAQPVIPPSVEDFKQVVGNAAIIPQKPPLGGVSHTAVKHELQRLHTDTDADFFGKLMAGLIVKFPAAIHDGKFVVDKLTTEQAKELVESLKLI